MAKKKQIVEIRPAGKTSKKYIIWWVEGDQIWANEKFSSVKEARQFIKQNNLLELKKPNKKRVDLVGKFYTISMKFVKSYKIGGNQKLQKIVGKDLYYQAETGDWFYANEKIAKTSPAKLQRLIDKLNEKLK